MTFDEEPTNMYNWIVYKRYSNFVDLHESLTPIFEDMKVEAPLLPPKIDLNEDIKRNEKLTDRKRGLQAYLRQVLQILANRMPAHLLIFLGIQEQNILGLKTNSQIQKLSSINLLRTVDDIFPEVTVPESKI